MGPGWSAQAGWPSPILARFGAPVDLDTPRTIYNPLAKRHTSIHSSSVLGDPKNRMDSQNTRVRNKYTKVATRRQRIPKSLYSPQKLWIPLHVPSHPLLYRYEATFYIPKIPSNLGNILSVNMYMNVFYVPWFAEMISYIYMSATSSHFKPGLLKRRIWLGFFLTLESLIHEDHHASWLSNFADSRQRSFTGSWFQSFASSWFRSFANSCFQTSATS
jgi:hypothetical protein